MKERPILFSAPMVRAILSGLKTQTRRVVKGSPVNMVRLMHKVKALDGCDEPTGKFGLCATYDRVINKHVECPLGKPGDRLWVRENFYLTDDGDSERFVYAADELSAARHINEVGQIAVKYGLGIDWQKPHLKLRPSIHMPRRASRITLEITDVRAERLQDITLADIVQEVGAGSIYGFKPAHDGFRVWQELWESINGAGAWDANPWVWAITFKRVDQLQAAA